MSTEGGDMVWRDSFPLAIGLGCITLSHLPQTRFLITCPLLFFFFNEKVCGFVRKLIKIKLYYSLGIRFFFPMHNPCWSSEVMLFFFLFICAQLQMD